MIRLTFLVSLCFIFSSLAFAKDWEMFKGDDFIVYYRLNVSEEFAKTVMDSAEEDFRQISENLGLSRYQSWPSEKRASIYIYSDEEDYIKNGGQAGWSHGAALISTKTIKTYPSDAGFFDAILPHELGHIVLHEFVGPYANVPLWFDEGVAMYQEKAKHIGSMKVVQEALTKGQFITLNELTDMRLYSNSKRETVDLFYAESASIVHFMITQLGEGHFYRLCKELKENTRFIEAVPKVYMNIGSLDDLNKKWVAYLKGNS
jgi:hypothetical protein